MKLVAAPATGPTTGMNPIAVVAIHRVAFPEVRAKTLVFDYRPEVVPRTREYGKSTGMCIAEERQVGQL